MAGEIAAAGIMAGGSLLNSAFNQIFAEHNRKRNYYWTEKLNEAQDARTRALYTDLYGPEALARQYANIGLSPSILYSNGVTGSSGIGGAGGQPANPNGGNFYGINPMDLANIELIKAQTRKTNAEADNEEGTGKIGQAKIIQMLADAGYKDAAKDVEIADSQLKTLELEIGKKTKDFSIAKVQYEAEQLFYQSIEASFKVGIAENELNFLNDTYESRVKQAEEEANKIVSDIIVNSTKSKLNEAQITEIKNNLGIALKQIEVEKTKNAILEEEKEIHKQQANTAEGQKEAYEKYVNSIEKLNEQVKKQIHAEIWKIKELTPAQKKQIENSIALSYMSIFMNAFK